MLSEVVTNAHARDRSKTNGICSNVAWNDGGDVGGEAGDYITKT